MVIPQLDGWLLLEQASKRLGMSRQWLYTLMFRGEVKAYYLGDPENKPIYIVSEVEVERVRLKRSLEDRKTA